VSVPHERLVYDVTVESMFCRALKGRLSSRVRERVKEAGIDLEAKLKPGYPREVWLRAMRIVVEELYSDVPEERAWFELGERLVASLRETVMGSATLKVLKLLGPQRALGRMSQTFRHANNYNQARLEEVGPRHVRLWVNEVGLSPHFIAGTVVGTLKAAGAESPRVEISEFNGQECTYSITF
jgi:uncharacterized protein (TIGR02265 family)